MRKIISLFIISALFILFLALFPNSNDITNLSGYFLLDLDGVATEKNSPYDRVKEEQIKVYDSLIIMDIEDSELVSLEDTNSMDPLIDSESNVIQVKPKTAEDIHVGDMVSYEFNKKIILHRVISMGDDYKGKFFLLKGDNADSIDPVKVRFDQIIGVVVAVVY